jgi:hypothetical protein
MYAVPPNTLFAVDVVCLLVLAQCELVRIFFKSVFPLVRWS